LLPLRWLPPRTMPPAAQTVQYVPEPRRPNTPEPHRERGIRQLLRIQRNRDDYLEFVTTVAELIVDATQNAPLPAETLSVQFEQVPSAFHLPVHLESVHLEVSKINNFPAAVNGLLSVAGTATSTVRRRGTGRRTDPRRTSRSPRTPPGSPPKEA
jgi:hypothetical protein